LKTTQRGNALTARTDHLGDFQIVQDDEAPREQGFTPSGSAPVKSSRPRIHASVSDAGSDIAAWELRCDGRWLLSSYDPEAELINWERDEDLPPGTHEITVTLTDGAGNTVTTKHKITVSRK